MLAKLFAQEMTKASNGAALTRECSGSPDVIPQRLPFESALLCLLLKHFFNVSDFLFHFAARFLGGSALLQVSIVSKLTGLFLHFALSLV
jgi:hypothetical protein